MRKYLANRHLYAVTSGQRIKPDGKPTLKVYIWGKLSESLVFTPNVRFEHLSMQEKRLFIFPQEWDITLAGIRPEEGKNTAESEVGNEG